jgi:hypothetical protein
MAHIALDDPQVDPRLKQMGGIRVTEGMNGDHLFSDSGGKLSPTKGPLDTAFGHGSLRFPGSISASADGWEDEGGMAMGDPIATEQVKGGLGEGYVAVLGALAPMDVDHHPVAVDIGDFEMETFLKSEAAGVDGGMVGIVLEGFDVGQEAADFFNAQDGRESSFGLGAEDSKNVPVALEDVFEKEAYPAIADPHGVG